MRRLAVLIGIAIILEIVLTKQLSALFHSKLHREFLMTGAARRGLFTDSLVWDSARKEQKNHLKDRPCQALPRFAYAMSLAFDAFPARPDRRLLRLSRDGAERVGDYANGWW